MKPWLRIVLCVALLGWVSASHAHKQSDSYLSLVLAAQGDVLEGRWDIALRDLEHAIGVDANADGAITWGELRGRQDAVAAYAFSRLSLDSVEGGRREPCVTRFQELLTDRHVDGGYAVLRFSARCPARPSRMALTYTLLFDVDPNHRGLLDLRASGSNQTYVFAQDHSSRILSVEAPQRAQQLRSFIGEGVWHILHGYDHVLFLLTLLLPAVVTHGQGRWQPRLSLRESVLDVVKVVTAFTLAHSLTLSVAVLGWISAPSRVVESTIAFTVVLGAANNLYPLVTRRRWLMAFAFGLVHGLGFASVLRDLGLEGGSLAFALLGFNAGVELGQLVIVLALVPCAYWIRSSPFYLRICMPVGAVAIGVTGLYWFVLRAFVS